MPRRRIVTLLTDFGLRDPYVAAMKGVLLSRIEDVTLVDISHEIPPQDVLGAAFVLAEAARCFPPGTVHVVVVDPGVGTGRSILAARYSQQTFLFPDNGVITQVDAIMRLEEMAVVRNKRYLPDAEPSMTFHGRDLFAPVAAHVANGLSIQELGPRPQTYKLLEIPLPAVAPGRIDGQVVYVDAFGNLVSNVPEGLLLETFEDPNSLSVFCGACAVGPLRGTYGDVEPGEPVALVNSMRLLEVAVNLGRANEALQAGFGTEIRVTRAGAET